MKQLTSFGTFIFVVLLASSVFASGVSLTGIGARATALGGNFRGIANDWSAMFWNPAGISQIKGMQFGISGEVLMLSGKYNFTQNVANPFGIYKTTDIENEPLTYFIPSVGFVYGLEKMSFGLSVYAPFGLGAEWDAMNTTGYSSKYPKLEYDDNLTVIDIHPTFAFQVNDKLSLGLGFSLVLTDIIMRTPKSTPNPVALGQFLEGIDTYNHILTDTELEGDGTGFGFNFGLKYNLTEDLSFGISGNWYNNISLDGKLSATTYYPEKLDASTQAQLEGTLQYLVDNGIIDETTRQMTLGGVAQVYTGAVQEVLNKEEGETDLPLPMTIGGGIAYTGIEKLLISADISWTQWSSWDVIEINLNNGEPQEILTEWDDAIRFGLGLEYQLTDLFKIRAGYYTEPSAIPDKTLDISIPDPGRRHAINIGASYNFGPLSLLASYESILIGERGVENWVLNEDKDGYENMAGKYNLTVNTLMFGIGFNF